MGAPPPSPPQQHAALVERPSHPALQHLDPSTAFLYAPHTVSVLLAGTGRFMHTLIAPSMRFLSSSLSSCQRHMVLILSPYNTGAPSRAMLLAEDAAAIAERCLVDKRFGNKPSNCKQLPDFAPRLTPTPSPPLVRPGAASTLWPGLRPPGALGTQRSSRQYSGRALVAGQRRSGRLGGHHRVPG